MKQGETTLDIDDEELPEYHNPDEFPKTPPSRKAKKWILSHKLETIGIIMIIVLGIVIAVSMTGGSDSDDDPSNAVSGGSDSGGSVSDSVGTTSMSPSIVKTKTPSMDYTKKPSLSPESPTASPTMKAPTVSPMPSPKPVYTSLYQILEELSPGIDFSDKSTPQAKAATWLVHQDKFRLEVNSPNILQRYALGTLYFATGGGLESASWNKCSAVPDEVASQSSSGGVDCVFDFGRRVICAESEAFEHCEFENKDTGAVVSSKRFLSPVHECSWYGIECDIYDRVTGVVLEENNLVGEIPREIVLLNVLNKLDLSTNSLSGEIRSDYFPLSLEQLLIDFNNGLSGAIDTTKFCSPPMSALFVDCGVIQCGNCCGCRTRPTPIQTKAPTQSPTKATITQTPTKAPITLTPTKAPITQTPTIEPTDVPTNEPTTTATTPLAPTTLSNTTTSLAPSTLDPTIDPTTLNPTIEVASQLGALMALYDNTGGDGWKKGDGWMSDTFECDWFGVKCNGGGILVELDLSDNNLVGDIPSQIGDLNGLKFLDLSDNKLSSSIPPEIGQLKELDELFLFGNPLDGAIPSEIGELVKLKALAVYDSAVTEGPTLSGPIPSEIANCKALKNMALQGNGLSGALPDEIYDLTELTNLRLQRNQLGGQISPLIANLAKLKTMKIETNGFTGALPAEIGDLTKLEDLLMHGNDFTGEVPGVICGLFVDEKLDVLTTDCDSDDIECDCCTTCF